jgi:hypothetical protein
LSLFASFPALVLFNSFLLQCHAIGNGIAISMECICKTDGWWRFWMAFAIGLVCCCWALVHRRLSRAHCNLLARVVVIPFEILCGAGCARVLCYCRGVCCYLSVGRRWGHIK